MIARLARGGGRVSYLIIIIIIIGIGIIIPTAAATPS